MKKVLKLENDLINQLKKADKFYAAVALMSEYGLEQIQHTAPEVCEIKLLVGIDLPTPATVFQQLFDMQGERCEARVYNHPKQFFHPKVYLVQTNGKWVAFVGSGNFTSGGFESNLEMSLSITDNAFCEGLQSWFNTYFRLGTSLSQNWIDEYEFFIKSRISRQAQDKNDVNSFKRKTSQQLKSKSLEDFDFEGQFFSYEHHQAFSGQTPYVSKPEDVEKRKKVRGRLLELHDLLWPRIEEKGWDIHHHHNAGYITSSVEHGLFTDAALHALWLHYGRSKDELNAFKEVYGEYQTSMYHMRLQVLVHELNVSVWLTVGKNGGGVVDREKLKTRLNNNDLEFKSELCGLITGLPNSFYIEINEERRGVKGFSGDEDLIEFIAKDKVNSNYFIIGREYLPDATEISEGNIVNTVINDFGLMLPIYNLIKTEPPKR